MTFTAYDPANLESILTSFGQAPYNLEVKTTANHTYVLPTAAPLTDNVMNIGHTSDSTGTMTVSGTTIAAGSVVSFMYSHETGGWYALTAGSSNGITALTGDVTATGPGSAAATVVSSGGGTGAFSTGVISLVEIISKNSSLTIKPTTDAVNAVNFTLADGTTSVLSINTLNDRVGIFTNTPSSNGFTPCLEVAGDIKAANYIDMGGHNAACLINMVNPFAGLGLCAMTTAQMNAITPNRAGNMVYVTDVTPGTYINNGSSWSILGGGGSGLVLQVLSTTSTAAFSTSSTSFTPVTGMSVTITPGSSSSRFLIQVTSVVQAQGGVSAHASILNGSTNLMGDNSFGAANMDGSAGADVTIAMSYIDSPATTSPITYNMGVLTESGGGTVLVNDSSVYASTITVTELAS